jgi:dolichol-phosphate mannosyltransferase
VSVTVVMPAYNEEEGIAGFISELATELQSFEPKFVVVNDVSTDSTEARVKDLAASGIPVEVHTNSVNLGHGPSTLRALNFGLDSHSEIVVAIDGDGQFLGTDVARLVKVMLEDPKIDVIEGVRTHRDDPAYRVVVSSVTRNLVWSRARIKPIDANTPLRVYRRESLVQLLDKLPNNSMTPNLLISAKTRRQRVNYFEINVQSIPRRGSDTGGSTWKSKTASLPSKRFIKFCTRAAAQWVSTPIKD